MGDPRRILLSSVFGPYARDDEYGSRSVNPMELYTPDNVDAAIDYAVAHDTEFHQFMLYVRARFRRECAGLPAAYAGALWAAERWLADRPVLARRVRSLRREIAAEFGLGSRLAAPVVGAFVLAAMHRERRCLRAGRTYEPPTFYETNRPQPGRLPRAALCRWVDA